MDCLNLSMVGLYRVCRKWCEKVKAQYSPEIVIYIARGGYIIGRAMEAGFQVPLIGIGASRQVNSLKEYCFPVLAVLPRRLCNKLRKMEIRSNVHQKKQERKISFHSEISKIKNPQIIKKILLVDDSIDTGHSMEQVKQMVQQYFPQAEIKIFVLNEMLSQKPIIKADYNLYQDTMIRSPMSKDSREYYKFLQIYKNRNQHLLHEKKK